MKGQIQKIASVARNCDAFATRLLKRGDAAGDIDHRRDKSEDKADIHKPNAPRDRLAVEAGKPCDIAHAETGNKREIEKKPGESDEKEGRGHFSEIYHGHALLEAQQVRRPAQQEEVARDDDDYNPQRKPSHEKKTQDARDHQKPVDGRIEQLPEPRNRMRSASKLAVDEIRRRGKSEHKGGENVMPVKKKHEIRGNHAEANRRNEVRESAYLVRYLFLLSHDFPFR